MIEWGEEKRRGRDEAKTKKRVGEKRGRRGEERRGEEKERGGKV